MFGAIARSPQQPQGDLPPVINCKREHLLLSLSKMVEIQDVKIYMKNFPSTIESIAWMQTVRKWVGRRRRTVKSFHFPPSSSLLTTRSVGRQGSPHWRMDSQEKKEDSSRFARLSASLFLFICLHISPNVHQRIGIAPASVQVMRLGGKWNVKR